MKLVINNDQILYTLRDTPRFKYDSEVCNSYIVWTLIPIAIYDYVNPDYSDQQGWLQDIPYTGELDYEEIVQYVCQESLKEALEDSGYSFIDVDSIYVVGEGREHSELVPAETAVANAHDLW